MIDKECKIIKQGKGFCWCPSSAWGVSDEQLCQLCQVKNAQVRKTMEFVRLPEKAPVFAMKKDGGCSRKAMVGASAR
jgi:hypothetical protein